MWAAPALLADGRAQPREQPPHLRRIGHAGGVGQPAFVGAGGHQLLGQRDDLVLVARAPCSVQPKAVEMPTSSPTRGRVFVAQATMARTSSTICSRVRAHVGQRMRGAGRHRHGELVHAGRERRLGAAQVGHQRHHRQAGQGARVAHQLGRVGQLRQQLGRHEGADLDLAQAGGVQRVDPGQLVRGGHGARHALQAVARADLADVHAVMGDRCHGGGSLALMQAGDDTPPTGGRSAGAPGLAPLCGVCRSLERAWLCGGFQAGCTPAIA